MVCLTSIEIGIGIDTDTDPDNDNDNDNDNESSMFVVGRRRCASARPGSAGH